MDQNREDHYQNRKGENPLLGTQIQVKLGRVGELQVG
jgi:hypothetical protein